MSLGLLLSSLLGRGVGDERTGARAPFVPPQLLSIAARTMREQTGQPQLRSAQAVGAALSAYLEKDAPRTDAVRVGRIMAELFPGGVKEDAARRQTLAERASAVPLPADSDPHATPPLVSTEGMTSDPSRAAGQVIDGRYRLRRLCGRGGMGWVYEAEHEAIGRTVALKILHPQYSRSQDIAERFRREARAASMIGHPHIAEVFDFGTTGDGCLYIAMEFLEGQDLGQLLEDEGLLPIARALNITAQVCWALDAAHAARVVHRDLKPENVFLINKPDNPDFVKVLDFGIAKYVEEQPAATRLTRPNIALGTPEYMAPEQVSGRVEPRSDIYALGAILFEMLVGAPPFEGENYLEVFRRKALEDPPAPSTWREEIPPEVDRIVLSALSRDPAGRPLSMTAMADEIAVIAGLNG
jgi:serine/threonine-protein kinase